MRASTAAHTPGSSSGHWPAHLCWLQHVAALSATPFYHASNQAASHLHRNLRLPADLEEMDAASLGALLQFYGEPVDGTRLAKRNRLKAFIGQY